MEKRDDHDAEQFNVAVRRAVDFLNDVGREIENLLEFLKEEIPKLAGKQLAGICRSITFIGDDWDDQENFVWRRGAYTFEVKAPKKKLATFLTCQVDLYPENAIPMLLIGLFDETGAFADQSEWTSEDFLNEKEQGWKIFNRFLYADSNRIMLKGLERHWLFGIPLASLKSESVIESEVLPLIVDLIKVEEVKEEKALDVLAERYQGILYKPSK